MAIRRPLTPVRVPLYGEYTCPRSDPPLPPIPVRRVRPGRRGGRSELPNGYRVEEAYRYLKTRIMSADLRTRWTSTSRSSLPLKTRDAQESMETMRRHLGSARQSLVLLS